MVGLHLMSALSFFLRGNHLLTFIHPSFLHPHPLLFLLSHKHSTFSLSFYFLPPPLFPWQHLFMAAVAWFKFRIPMIVKTVFTVDTHVSSSLTWTHLKYLSTIIMSWPFKNTCIIHIIFSGVHVAPAARGVDPAQVVYLKKGNVSWHEPVCLSAGWHVCFPAVWLLCSERCVPSVGGILWMYSCCLGLWWVPSFKQ